MACRAGIFVGGGSTRMGGAPKGLLRTRDGTEIVARTAALLRELGCPVVLVGAHPAYRHLGLPTLADAAAGSGPLGGLVALLESGDADDVVALACDMPFISAPLLLRLMTESPDAPVLAPRREGRWEPLFARHRPSAVRAIAARRLAEGALSLQGVMDEAGAIALPISPAEALALRDWDRPEDIHP